MENLREELTWLKDLKNSDRRLHHFLLASSLGEIGQMWQRIYKKHPEKWLKEFLIYLSEYIKIYEESKKIN